MAFKNLIFYAYYTYFYASDLCKYIMNFKRSMLKSEAFSDTILVNKGVIGTHCNKVNNRGYGILWLYLK